MCFSQRLRFSSEFSKHWVTLVKKQIHSCIRRVYCAICCSDVFVIVVMVLYNRNTFVLCLHCCTSVPVEGNEFVVDEHVPRQHMSACTQINGWTTMVGLQISYVKEQKLVSRIPLVESAPFKIIKRLAFSCKQRHVIPAVFGTKRYSKFKIHVRNKALGRYPFGQNRQVSSVDSIINNATFGTHRQSCGVCS